MPPIALMRASTAAILANEAVLEAVGPLRAFNRGQPYSFGLSAVNGNHSQSLLLRTDGVLLTQRCARATAMVLVNFVHLAPREAHVATVVKRCEALKHFLRLSPDDKFPRGLGAHRSARVVPFLSGVRFTPAMQGAALDAGVVPLLCSGEGADAVCVLAPGAEELLAALR
jgi:hypothetical protein